MMIYLYSLKQQCYF